MKKPETRLEKLVIDNEEEDNKENDAPASKKLKTEPKIGKAEKSNQKIDTSKMKSMKSFFKPIAKKAKK